MSGFDRRFPAPLDAYEDYFKAYHMSRFPGRERKDVSYGGKVIMPPSALSTITDLELESPWTFAFRGTGRSRSQRTHAGVVEFIAEEGKIYLPSWVSYRIVAFALARCLLTTVDTDDALA